MSFSRGAHTNKQVDPATLKADLIQHVRSLQSNLTQLQSLHGLDPATLSYESYERTESLLFDSRGVCRKISELMKAMGESTYFNKGAKPSPTPSPALQTLQPMFLALQNAVEKVATLLLAKHRELGVDQKGTNSAAAAIGEKRKRTDGSSTSKRVKGGIIQPIMDVESLKPHHKSSSSTNDPSQQVTEKIDTLESQVLTLQKLQEKLTRSNSSTTSSGHSTPGRSSSLLSARPHSVSHTPRSFHSMDYNDDERMDDGPMSTRSNDTSMSSEADSEQTMGQRHEMIQNLMENIQKLRQRIADEKAGQPTYQQPHVPSSDDVNMTDVSDGGLLDETKEDVFQPAANVPRLDLAALTSTCSALEALLQKSLATMSELAAVQERELRKKEMKQMILTKGSTFNATSKDLGLPFATQPASSFAGKTFRAAQDSDTARPQPADYMANTEAARSLDAVNAAVMKKSDVPRVKQTPFDKAPRFVDPNKKTYASKQAERKALYQKYEQLFQETKKALLETERKLQQQQAGNAVEQDPLLAALAATKPRLIQNITMGQVETTKPEPRSALARIIAKEREEAERRTRELGPGAYELDEGLAKTQRRTAVGGVTSWGAGPPSAMEIEEDEQIPKTERFVTKQPASGTLGPGSHVISEVLVTKRLPGPKMLTPAEEMTDQLKRAKEILAETERKKVEYEFEKNYDELDKTVRKKVSNLGALSLAQSPPSEKQPTVHQQRAERQLQEKLAKIASEYEVREEKIEELARTRRAEEEAAKTHRLEEFRAKLEDERKLEEPGGMRLALGPMQTDLNPNYDYPRPRKPAFRYAPPPARNPDGSYPETNQTKHGVSARKRSAAQLTKQEKREEAAEQKLAKIEAHQHRINALRSSQGLNNMTTMLGRPKGPEKEDTRDYNLAKGLDFVQLGHIPGDNWARGAKRPVAEADLDPEVDDIIGGQEGDVLDLDLQKADKWTKPRVKGAPAWKKSYVTKADELQTLSDTELDYANQAGSLEEPSQLNPNYDFVRKRQGLGGPVRFDRMILGGTRSNPGSDAEEDEFPYLAEGTMNLSPNFAAREAKVPGGAFAKRRKEFLALHKQAKEREAAKAAEEAEKLILNPHLATGHLRHKPAASLKFSARHDTLGSADDELDDMEAYGEYNSTGIVKTRGGPAAYEPKYAGWKDAHTPASHFGKSTGRPELDPEDDELEGRADHRDFLGGIHASKPNPARAQPNTALPGVSFSKAPGRADLNEDEDRADFPDLYASGDWLNLNPKKSASKIPNINMARTTGRNDLEKDELDYEDAQEGHRLDLRNLDALRKTIPSGPTFGQQVGRRPVDVLDPTEGDTLDLQLNYGAVHAKPPDAVFLDAARFDATDGLHLDLEPAASALDPKDTLTRSKAPSAFFGDEAARPGGDLAKEGAKLVLQPTRIDFERHPQIDFTHGAVRGITLPPMEKPKGSELPLNPNHDAVHPTPSPGPSFPRALRSNAPVIPGLEQRQGVLDLNPLPPTVTSSSGGTTFGKELRPGQAPLSLNALINRQEGSVLYPEMADELVRRSHPEWSFTTEKRFGSDPVRDTNEPASRLTLQLDSSRAAIEPKSPAAFFPDEKRHTEQLGGKDGTTSSSPTDPILVLSPNHNAVLPTRVSITIPKDQRFPSTPLDYAPVVPKPLNVSSTPDLPPSISPKIGRTNSYTKQDISNHASQTALRLSQERHQQQQQQLNQIRLSQELAKRRADYPSEAYLLDLLASDTPRSEVDGGDGAASASTSFDLPVASGVVATTASLIKARRDQQALVPDRVRKSSSAAVTSATSNPALSSSFSNRQRPTSSIASVTTTTPSSFPSSTGSAPHSHASRVSIPTTVPGALKSLRYVPPVTSATLSPSPPVIRKTVQFADEDDEQDAPELGQTLPLKPSKKVTKPILKTGPSTSSSTSLSSPHMDYDADELESIMARMNMAISSSIKR